VAFHPLETAALAGALAHAHAHAEPQHPYAEPQQPVPEPMPKANEQPVPEPIPEPMPKAERDELLSPRYAHLQMTEQERADVHTLIEMGFPNVDVDVYYLRQCGGTINDILIETLAGAL